MKSFSDNLQTHGRHLGFNIHCAASNVVCGSLQHTCCHHMDEDDALMCDAWSSLSSPAVFTLWGQTLDSLPAVRCVGGCGAVERPL